MKKQDLDLKIPPDERTPVVMALLSVIETLTQQLTLQSEKIDILLEEIRRLKKISSKPKLSASKLPKDPDDSDDNNAAGKTGSGKRAGSAKRSKIKN